MNEAIKTLLYVVGAIAVTLTAALTYPRQEDFEVPDLVGKALFEDFTDPEEADELQIIKFREDVGEFSEFRVTRNAETGLWVIPSSGNYPADADQQMRDAATSLIDLKVLGVASELASEHETYGVIEPSKQLDRSQEGVGLSVSFRDAKGNDLASVIIGKLVKGTTDQHFVRKPGIDSVYVVKIDPQKFPAEFSKWIERDLLKLNPFDIQRVTLRDYSLLSKQTSTGPRGTLSRRFDADVTWDADRNKWKLNELIQYRNGTPSPTELLDVEELNAARLNDLKTALGDMEIVGVMRKPPGLGSDLKAGTAFTDDTESLISLSSRGFYLASVAGGQPELHAANGELAVTLNNGVQYLLRFGKTADITEQTVEGKLSRYLFVSVGLDESMFPPLELEPLPGGDTIPEGLSPAQRADLELNRERVRKENQRKQDQREEQLRNANQKISELNARFADWYYIIPDDVYQRVHLSRNDLIRESAAATEQGFGVDAFRKLQREGIEPPQPKTPASPFMQPGLGR